MFVLAQGVINDAPVLADNIAFKVQERARLGPVIQDPLDGIGVLPVGHEADILAVGFVGVDESVLLGDLPGMGLVVSAQGETGMGQLLLGQVVQYIALVLFRVQGFQQFVFAGRFIFPDAGVVAGDHAVAAQLPGPLVQSSEFQELVAVDTRIGRMAQGVAAGKFFHDIVFEFLGVVEYVKGHAQPGTDAAGVFHIAEAAAGFGAAVPCIRVVVQFHVAADAVVPCILHQFGGYGAVHPAAHGNESFHDDPFYAC